MSGITQHSFERKNKNFVSGNRTPAPGMVCEDTATILIQSLIIFDQENFHIFSKIKEIELTDSKKTSKCFVKMTPQKFRRKKKLTFA